MVVNVCPAGVAKVPPERVWNILTSPERFDDWVDARFVSAEPSGPVRPGQVIKLSARSLGREWPVTIEVRELDPQHRWMDLLVHLPFRVDNHEHLTLTETKDGATLIRLN